MLILHRFAAKQVGALHYIYKDGVEQGMWGIG
jgi:hypothetical protein